MNSQQIIKPEKFNFNHIIFDAVSKNIIFEDISNDNDSKNMKKIINYWFDNKIKIDGFSGSLSVIVKNIDTNIIKKDQFFKFTINTTITFKLTTNDSIGKKTHTINSSDFGELTGNFSIKDQENLTLNVMHKTLINISNKLLSLN